MYRSFLAAISLGLLLSLMSCGDDSDAESVIADNSRTEDLADPTAERTGPLPDGGASSCVESYSPGAVKDRAFAFDGVVVAIGPPGSDRGDDADLGLPGVTFEVQEWFSGGTSKRVTVDLQNGQSDALSESGGDVYGMGSRLLVSGEPRWGGTPLEAPIAWACGFSRYYDEATAAAWRDAIGG